LPHLLIYTDFDSPRLRYVLNWIFGERLGLSFCLTGNRAEWEGYEGPKLCYAQARTEGALHIVPHTLLNETGVREIPVSINRWKHSTILFYNQPGAQIPFDLFAAVFYLVSRYEEYLPHSKDKHGRYDAAQSAAAQYAFLQEPVADTWIFQLGKLLERLFGLAPSYGSFTFLPTYDIDIAWKYLHKGASRTLGGLLRDAATLKWGSVAEHLRVNAGRKKDPFDSFGFLDGLHRQYQLKPLYFLLLGNPGPYDKNAAPGLPAMQSLLRLIAGKYETGIHPSYRSNEERRLLREEIALLAKAAGRPVTKSRQHYIRLRLPETYRTLYEHGIKEDYSMGYASCNGFRAGTSQSFLWYDLEKEAATALRIYPFAFMEATSRFYLEQSPEEAWLEWERLWHAVKKVNGSFISIWHNYMLGSDRAARGWPQLYEKTLAYNAAHSSA